MCEKYHCLPSQLEQEDGDMLEYMVLIASLDSEQQEKNKKLDRKRNV